MISGSAVKRDRSVSTIMRSRAKSIRIGYCNNKIGREMQMFDSFIAGRAIV
jgi:hypothetical protein